MTTAKRVQHDQTANPCLLAEWLIEAIPAQHPIWRHYSVRLISLADMPDTPPAYKALPNATHEIALIALDSEARPVFDQPKRFIYLRPINYAAQFSAPDDAAAVSIAQVIVDWFVAGRCILEIQGLQGGKEVNDHYIDAAVKRFEAGLIATDN